MTWIKKEKLGDWTGLASVVASLIVIILVLAAGSKLMRLRSPKIGFNGL
jgi:hypothetical protein